MLNGKLVLAVVPARGGSKGLPGKNLKKVCGRSLVEWAIATAMQCPEVDVCLLSTDSEAIVKAAERVGLSESYRRPIDLSGDRVSDVQVLAHAVRWFEERSGQEVGCVVMLQPTSPLRRVEEISAGLRMLESGHYDSIWSVSEVDLKYHPLKQLSSSEDLLAYHSPEGSQVIARQQLEPTLIRNGLFYVADRNVILELGALLGERCGFFKVDRPTVSIDDLDDLKLARRLFRDTIRSEEDRSPAS